MNNLNETTAGKLHNWSWEYDSQDREVLLLTFQLLRSPVDECYLIYFRRVITEKTEKAVRDTLDLLGFTGEDYGNLQELLDKQVVVNLVIETTRSTNGKDYCNVKFVNRYRAQGAESIRRPISLNAGTVQYRAVKEANAKLKESPKQNIASETIDPYPGDDDIAF